MDPGFIVCEACFAPFYTEERLRLHKCNTRMSNINRSFVNMGSTKRFPISTKAKDVGESGGSSSAAKKDVGMTLFACGDCGANCGSISTLKVHQSVMHHGPFKSSKRPDTSSSRAEQRKSITCRDCSRDFEQVGGLLDHQRAKQHGLFRTIPRTDYRCPVDNCVRVIQKMILMLKHLDSAHPTVDWSIPSNSNPSAAQPPTETPTVTQPPVSRLKETEATTSMTSPQIKEHQTDGPRTAANMDEWKQKSRRPQRKCTIKGCTSSFVTERALQKHQQEAHAGGKSNEFRCLDCDRDFVSATALGQHLSMKVHVVRPTLLQAPPNTCTTCNKTFRSAGGLRSHAASRKHKPISPDLSCIRPGCGKKFDSPSAMLQHLESGNCSEDIDVFTVNKTIMDNDPTGIITDAQARKGLEDWRKVQQGLIFASEEAETVDSSVPTGATENQFSDYDEDEDGGVQIFTPNSFDSASEGVSVLQSGEMTPTSYNSTRRASTGAMMTPTPGLNGGLNPAMLESELALLATQAYNTKRYTCPLCPADRKFLSRGGLETHLRSAKHAPKIFHCPTSLIDGSEEVLLGKKKKNHFKMFTTLSGLAQHLEAGACKGGSGTFDKVIRFVEARLKEMGLEGRLLTSSEPPTIVVVDK